MKNFKIKFTLFGLLAMLFVSITSCTDKLIDHDFDVQKIEVNDQLANNAITPHHLDDNKNTEPQSAVLTIYDNEIVERGCGSDVYWKHYRPYHALYVTWFYAPTYANCIAMQVAYCNYLIAYHNCYGGGPVTSCDEYFSLCY